MTSIAGDIEKYETLIGINSLINSDYSDINALLKKILESAMRLVNADAASLLLVDNVRNKLVFTVALGPKGPVIKDKELELGDGIAGWVALNNKSLIIDDTADDPRFFSGVQKTTGYITTSMIAVPLRLRDKCIGVIEIINKSGNSHFTQEDLKWTERFMDQAAIAYQNARNLSSVNYQVAQLQNSLDKVKGFHTLVFTSPLIREKLDLVDKVAVTNSSVLLLGESGVGKELFAEQIHLRSNRKNGPFVRVNCAALPETMLESELFGHVRGAFTDAVSDRTGRFEAARGGTIFLDEIGEIPLSIQGKLLRVLQDKSFERLGSSETISVDVRIVAATNRDLEKLMEKGSFRSDLYYRLSVFPLKIPPLREHKEDIPLLLDFFLKKNNWEQKKEYLGFTPEAVELINNYRWPGNIRELGNTVEQACVYGTPPYITPEDLVMLKKTLDIPETSENSPGDNLKDLKSALDGFKAKYIKSVLEFCSGNQTEAAKKLDIQRTYLSRLIKELKIKI